MTDLIRSAPRSARIIQAARLCWAGLMTALVVLALAATNAAAKGRSAGAVYTMTNATSGNAILAFQRDADGSLTADGSYATGGLGTGAGLGNQGGLTLSANRRWLLAVNAGSNDVSLFRVNPHGLRRTDVAASGGTMPISVTVSGRLVYVLNAGSPANVTGFVITPRGGLEPLAGSTRPLSAASVAPAQVGFAPDGSDLVVTEKATNQVVTFSIDQDGYATGPNVYPSPGTTPFGFAFDSTGHLFVTEAFGGVPGGSATSSFDVASDGTLAVISPSVLTHQTAACWAVVTPDDRYLYVANAGSNSVSGYAIADNGSISLLDADGLTADTGAGSTPIDMAISRNGRYLYVLLGGTSAIAAYRVESDGSLTSLPGISGLPGSRNGIAAF